MRFSAYRKALELFECVADDVGELRGHPELTRLVAQQLASANSVASNIEEGYGRGSAKDYARFLEIARGSAQETAGRYGRLRRWLETKDVDARISLCSEIVAILTTSIATVRARKNDATAT